MTNKELIEIANMELRDQLEAERVKVKKLKTAISSALNYLACPDDLTELNGKCNEQMAFDVLREAIDVKKD